MRYKDNPLRKKKISMNCRKYFVHLQQNLRKLFKPWNRFRGREDIISSRIENPFTEVNKVCTSTRNFTSSCYKNGSIFF